MSEWREVKLGEFCKIQGGYAFKSTDFIQKGIPVVKIKNVKEREIDLNDCGYVDESMAEKCSDFLIKNGDVLISMTGSGMNAPNSIVGRVARHTGSDSSFLINQRVGRFMIKDKNHLDKHFLFHYLTPKERQWELVSIATGSANQVNISGKQIESLLINLPPLPEQKAIAHILGSLDDKIELNRKMNQTLEAMAQAMFKSWFVDFDPVIDNALVQRNEIPEELQARVEKRRRVIAGDVIANPDEGGMKQSPSALKPLLHTNPALAAQFPASFVFNETLGKWIPEGWEVKTIKEFGKVVCGKTPSKSNPEFYGGSIPFVKIPNMHNEVFVLSTEEYLTEKGSESQANKLIPPGSISVSCIATVGKVIITNQPCHTNQQINSVVPNKLIYRYFLYFTMLNLERHFHDLASAGSTTLNMNTSTFSNISILFPSKEVLSEFHKLVFPKFSKILLNQIEKETLTNLRDRLLPELISGRVRVKVISQ